MAKSFGHLPGKRQYTPEQKAKLMAVQMNINRAKKA